MERLLQYMDQGIELSMIYLPKLTLAFITLVLGLKLIRCVAKLFEKIFEKNNIDLTLRPFILSMFTWSAKIMLLISVASMIGVETTSFIAVLGAMGLAIGLSLQGTLSNFAGGILLLLFKRFKVGDVITLGNVSGIVREIQIFNTIVKSWDRSIVTIPNGSIANGNVINYSVLDHGRNKCVVGIAYDSDLSKVKNALLEMLNDNPKVLKDPSPIVFVSNLGDNAMELTIQAFSSTRNGDIWDMYFSLNEDVKLTLDKNNIRIPFPQMDIHVDNIEKSIKQ